MNQTPVEEPGGSYGHDLLLHDTDAALVSATRTFVAQGLDTGGRVLVHGSRERLAMMRSVLPSHPRLDFGFDGDLYRAPIRTLFGYQRQFAESEDRTDLWATGTVPFGGSAGSHAAWARYESLVNEALEGFAFHGLCTYDVRELPGSVVDVARATHPCVVTGDGRAPSPEYQRPAEFYASDLADVPNPPRRRPTVGATIHSLDELGRVRQLVQRWATAYCAAPRETVGDFVIAVNEVAANGLVHGAAPVDITLWCDLATLTCQIVDAGHGIHDTLAGYRYPDQCGPMGLWAARQMCADVFVTNLPEGGCSVLLSTE